MYEKLKVYNNYANECIFFKYIFDEADLKENEESEAADSSSRKKSTNGGGKENHMNGVVAGRSGSWGSKSDNCKQVFKPEFTHQIFGDDESIFGYRNLRIDYYLTPGLLEAYIGLKYKDKVSAQRFDGIEPDDVYDAFTKFGCSPGFTRQLDVFVSEKLKKDAEFRPFGNKIHEYKMSSTSEAGAAADSTFEVYKVDSKCPEATSERFLSYMDRIQTMLVYYIETSCFIDSEDPQWSFFILYEKKGKTNSDSRYVTCGFISVYEYYAYPDKVRSRISQMLIFPTYQNMGHGSRLMESVYTDACQVSNILEVTAESPSDEFIHLRDYVTCKMCATLDTFRSKDALKKGFSNEMAQEALARFKLSRLQSRRCYEILRLAITNQSKTDEWRDYRLDLKKRFYLPFIRRTKFARGSGASTSAAAAAAAGSSSAAAGEPSKPTSLTDRFGKASNVFSRLNGGGGSSSTIVEEDEDEYSGKTTIGFGRPGGSSGAQIVESTSIGFGSSASSKASNLGASVAKSVSFSNQIKNDLAKVFANGLKKANLKLANNSNSSMDNSNNDDDNEDDDDEDDDESDASSDAGLPMAEQPNLTNLLVSPEERKKYLEEKFQESIVEYRKVIRRLENANIIS